MKKILNNLVKHLDKVILAALMVVLIATISWQYISLAKTLKLLGAVKKIDLLADLVDASGHRHPKKPYPKLNVDQFNLSRDVKVIWGKPYTYGKWAEYSKAGDDRIFRNYPTPPKNLSEDMRKWLKEIGPGTLFDPHLYTFSKDSERNELTAFETVRAHYSPYPPEYDEEKIVTPPGDDDDDDDVKPPVAEQKKNLSAWIRLGKTDKPALPFILRSVAGLKSQPKETWALTFEVTTRRGSKKFPVVKIGNGIPGTNYKVIDARVETTIEKKFGAAVEKVVYQATVQSGDGPRIRMKEKTKVLDPLADPTYLLVYFPIGKKYLRMKDGQKRKFDYDDISQTYQLTVEDDEPHLYLMIDGKVVGKAIPLKKWSNREYEKWRSDEKIRLEKEREQEGVREDEMEEGPRPPDGTRRRRLPAPR